MANLLSENEFTERFTEAIKDFKLEPKLKESLTLELHYGNDEPVLTLSLKDMFARYQAEPEKLEEFMQPYLQDLSWTVQEPRHKSKDIYEKSLPLLRNFFAVAPSEEELSGSFFLSKGPIVFEEVLKTADEYLVMQFAVFQGAAFTALCKGDTLPCIPDNTLLTQLSLHNLALCTESAGLTAVPLQFESLKARCWLIGFGDEALKPAVAALSCIPQVMNSLEETFKSESGLIAILPTSDQLIVSIDTNDEAIVELGVLGRQITSRSENPLSSMVWTYQSGNLVAVQALDLQEVKDSQPT